MADEDDDLVLRKYFGVHDKSLRELYTSTSSDATFYKLAEKIERRAAKSGKTVKHRVECWLRKLCQQTSNYDWKKNRNHYATLLLEMLESGKLEFPFDKRPEEGPLKTLPTYLRPFASGGVVRAEKPKQTSRPESARRRADKAEDVVNIASAAVDVLHEHNVSRSAASEADGSGFGYRYDAEIQLGACRERCLELEMQVNVKNDQIDRLERKLAKARKAHEVDVQRYRGKIQSLKDTYTKNLGEIIKRYTAYFAQQKRRAVTKASREAAAPLPPRQAARQDLPRESREDPRQYVGFLENLKNQMQVLKRNLEEEQAVR